MMAVAIEEFRQKVGGLKRLIELIEAQRGGLRRVLEDTRGTPSASEAQGLLTKLDGAFRELREFENDGIVIVLYGSFERFVEGLVRDYLESLAGAVPYAALPERVREGHLAKSAAFLPRLDLPRFSGLGLTPESVLRNAVACLDGARPYRLNVHAYQFHTANVRHGVISELLGEVGIEGAAKAATAREPLKTLLTNMFGGSVAQRELAEVLRVLDDLAALRNDIAHGAAHVSQSPAKSAEDAEFLLALAEALVDVAGGAFWANIAPHAGPALPPPIAVHGGKVACFSFAERIVAVGDRLIVATGDGWRGGDVLEIQVAGTAHTALDTRGVSPAPDIALRVGFPVKKNHTFYLLAR